VRKIVVVHFSPPELYPPLQNFLQVLSTQIGRKGKIYLFTTNTTISSLSKFNIPSSNTKIIRLGVSGTNMPRPRRYANFIWHYLGVLFYLVKLSPGKILYYETLSSFAPVLYKLAFNRKTRLYIHYHEYTSPEEYRDGPALQRFFHSLEKKIYTKSAWLSHTNAFRLNLFKQDIAPIRATGLAIYPNYPPSSWLVKPGASIPIPVKIVYAGSLDTKNMFAREFADWVISHNGKIKWDIYSYNFSKEAYDYFSELNSPFISLNGGVDYKKLPEVLRQYDIGVILYKGHIKNHVYNAPNKLFECLVSGLDVWYPDQIVGCYEYDTTQLRPKVIRLNFQKLQSYSLSQLTAPAPATGEKNCFTVEESSKALINNLLN
jgi:hypothetical protein